MPFVLIHIQYHFLYLLFLLVKHTVSLAFFNGFCCGFLISCYLAIHICVWKSLFGNFGLDLFFGYIFCCGIVCCENFQVFVAFLIILNFCQILFCLLFKSAIFVAVSFCGDSQLRGWLFFNKIFGGWWFWWSLSLIIVGRWKWFFGLGVWFQIVLRDVVFAGGFHVKVKFFKVILIEFKELIFADLKRIIFISWVILCLESIPTLEKLRVRRVGFSLIGERSFRIFWLKLFGYIFVLPLLFCDGQNFFDMAFFCIAVKNDSFQSESEHMKQGGRWIMAVFDVEFVKL